MLLLARYARSAAINKSLSVRRLHKQEKIQTEIKIIAESIGFFSASASIVDFGSTMGHGICEFKFRIV